MTHGLTPYPAYKDSGVSWLGKIPAHWDVLRAKRIFREMDQRSTTGREAHLSMSQSHGLVDSSMIDDWRLQSESYAGGKLCRKNDLVLNRLKAHLGVFAHARQDGIVSPDYTIYRLLKQDEVRFFELLFRTPLYKEVFRRATKGIVEGFWRLYTDDFYDVCAPIPPQREQRAILRWLARIDGLTQSYIRAKQRLIELLNEQKRAIIHRAVTRGLDPNVRLKPSGVEWLGDVPEHWEVRRLKTLCSMRSGDGITAMSVEPAGDYPVYGGNGVRGYTSSYTHDGDFALIGRQGALCGNVHIAHGRFWASEHAVVASLRPGHVLDWFGAILVVMNLNQYSIAAAQPGLAVERVLNLSLPVPPAQEQARIAKHIEQETADITKAVDRAQREIALLREYRTRLVADVVTGKVDVRELAAGMPEVEEAEQLDKMPLEDEVAADEKLELAEEDAGADD